LYDKDELYSVFSNLPSFTYVIMGNIIMLFIVELIAQYKSSQRITPQNKMEHEKRRKIVNGVRIFVIVEIIIVMGLFCASIIIRHLKKDADDQKLRELRLE
jgi:heme/copper-type cytochrome/quinol oxidase subunit 3